MIGPFIFLCLEPFFRPNKCLINTLKSNWVIRAKLNTVSSYHTHSNEFCVVKTPMKKVNAPWTKVQKEQYWEEHPTCFPVKKAVPRLPAQDLIRFGNLIAGDYSKYEAYITIAMRGACTGQSMVHVASVRARDFGEWLSRMTVVPNVNYYFTKSQTKKLGHWSYHDLYSLNALIVDLDDHRRKTSAEVLEERATTEKRILDAIDGVLVEDNLLCQPNIVVHTGRGMQLIWLLDSAAKDLAGLYRFVCRCYAEKIQSLLSGDEELARYHVDRACSERVMGLNRLPGTYNTATRTLVTFDVIHEYRMDLAKEFENQLMLAVRNGFVLGSAHKPKRKEKKKQTSTQFFHTEGVGKARVRSLMQLLEARGATVDVGLRDQFCFVLYNALRMAGKTAEEALAEVLAVNRTFEQPLPERRLAGYLGTAMHKPYKMSNTYIIETLEISAAEQTAIRLFPTKAVKQDSAYKNAARDQRRKASKVERDSTVITLFQQGLKKVEIAERVKISRNTVTAILRRYQADVLSAVLDTAEATKETVQNVMKATTDILQKVQQSGKGLIIASTCQARTNLDDLYNLYRYARAGPKRPAPLRSG